MTTEPEKVSVPSPDLDSEDLWVRGRVYVHFKRLLGEVEARIPDLEHDVARAQYEYEIAQRIRDKATDAEARQDWDTHVSVTHDFMMMAEHELAEETTSAAYYRAMVTEMEADLGDKAQVYEDTLSELYWGEEWDEEDLGVYDEFDPLASIPF